MHNVLAYGQKKIYFENARYFVRLRVELNVLADARDIFSRRKH